MDLDRKNSTRPRLMFVLGLAPRKIGGIEKFLRYLVLALDHVDWDTILCFDGPATAEFRRYFDIPSVTLERLDEQGDLGFACAASLWRLLRKHRPTVFVHAFHSVLRCFPWLAKIAGCKRIVFNDHSSRPYAQKAVPLRPLKRFLGRILTYPLTSVISVSDFTRRTGNLLGVTKVTNHVIRNGVEICPADCERREDFRRRFGIPSKAIVITQVCWMVEVKGVETLLRAAVSLLKRYPDARFLLVGEGSELRKYQRIAADLGVGAAVIFTGLISEPTSAGVYDASDVYCQPSVWQEACPLAVLEAMSASLPVIASRTGGLPELVQDGLSGILIPVGNSDELFGALARLIGNPDLRRRMGQAGYDLVVKEHRIEETARRYVNELVGYHCGQTHDQGYVRHSHSQAGFLLNKSSEGSGFRQDHCH